MVNKPALRFSLLSLLLCTVFHPGLSQDKKTKKIEIKRANTLIGNEAKGIRKLIGNVHLRHDSVDMFCDSAYLYSNQNSIDAYGHVHIKQGDTLQMWGDSLKYNGNTRIAQLRHNVRVRDQDMTLTTDYLDYDRNNEMAYYMGGGHIVSRTERNNLTSKVGYYYPKSKNFHFKHDVVLINPDYQIYSDTLLYNTQSKITYFFGPTTIRSDGNTIYCENGWYSTASNKAQFRENAWIVTGSQKVEGDSICYDRNSGIGEAYYNVTIIDTTEDFQLNGNKAIHYEKDSISMITENAMLTQFFSTDTLYLHADTLLAIYDSTRKHRIMHAWYQVKFYKPDMQGKCDSLIFSDADSSITLFTDPVMWSEVNQMTGDSIRILMYDGEVRKLFMDRNAFITSEVDTTKYNQIKGKNMIGWFRENRLRKIDVNGNGQTVYYVKEDDGKMIGMNRTDCSDMVIYVDSSEVKKITFFKEPKATLYPLDQINSSETKLQDFRWRGDIRPLKKEDIFIWGVIPRDTVTAQPDSLGQGDLEKPEEQPQEENPKTELTEEEIKKLKERRKDKFKEKKKGAGKKE